LSSPLYVGARRWAEYLHTVLLDSAGSDVEIGDTVEIVPVHACPVANLASELTVVRDDTVIGRWAVAAAGRVR
jgi:D-serine deaminase-like pyridoxal phosphate-dependent protein